jgi:minor extracellular serine protease Vpr
LTKETLKVDQTNGKVNFSINYPEEWSYAKISLMLAGSHEVKTIGITPQETRSMPIHNNGKYWIQADILAGNKTDHAYQTLMVNNVKEIIDIEDILRIPIKQIVIISFILIIVITVGLVGRYR